MKLTIEGSTLANHMSPLAANVRQHEGIDYDRIYLSIASAGDKNYLDARVDQPTCTSYVHLNLSGVKQDGDGVVVGVDAIDGNAETAAEGTVYVMKATDLANVNRNVGAGTGTYIFNNTETMNVTLGDNSKFTKACESTCMTGYIMRHRTPESDDNDKNVIYATPQGSVSAADFAHALESAMRMCRLVGSKGGLTSQAIHLCIRNGKMTVEGLAHNGAIAYSIQHTDLGKEPADVHIALSLPAARKLLNMCRLTGTTLYWSLDAEKSYVDFTTGEFSLRALDEGVENCIIEQLEDKYFSFNVNRVEFLRALRRVSVAGTRMAVLSYETANGNLVVSAGDMSAVSKINVQGEFIRENESEVNLPAGALYASVQAFADDQLLVKVSRTQGIVELTSGDDIRCVVLEV